MLQRPELVVEKELRDLIFTESDCTPLKTLFFYKRMKRDKRGNRLPCTACNKKTDTFIEGKIDCPYCEGLGYQWEEGKAYGFFYKKAADTDKNLFNTEPGVATQSTFNKQYLVVMPEIDLRQGDFVLRLAIERGNSIKLPIQVEEMHQISEAEKNRSSNGGIDFITNTLVTDNRDIFRGILHA